MWFLTAISIPNVNVFLFKSWSTISVEENIYSGLDHAKQQLLFKWEDGQLKQWYIWYLPMKLISALDAKFLFMRSPTSYFHTFFVHILTMANNKCSLKEYLSGWSSHGAYLQDQFQLLMCCYLPSGSLCPNICVLIVVNPNCFSVGGYQNKHCYEISLPS